MSGVDIGKTVAMIWVTQDGDEMTLAIDSRNDVIPYDRRQLARALHQLGDRLTELSDTADGEQA